MYNDFNYERFINSDELRQTTQYVVKQGESIYSIANKFDVSVNDLVKLNKLSSTMIYPNQVIFIPSKKPSNNPVTQHVTMLGDTIASLTHKYGDKYDYTLLRVEANQVLRPKNQRQVIVDETMTLDSILNDNNLTADEFLRLNEFNIVKPGSKIIT